MHKSGDIAELHYDETPQLDVSRLERLVQRLGPGGADLALTEAVEDMLTRLGAAQRAHDRGDAAACLRASLAVAEVSARIGLRGCDSAARQLGRAAEQGDRVARAATLARLHRLCDRSIMQLWALDDTGA